MAGSTPGVGFDLTVARLAPRTHVATVTGELDLYAEPALRRRLLPFASLGGATLIVDLCGTPYIDATALATLTTLGQLLRSGGGDLVIATGDPRLQRLLEITGLLSVMSLETSLAGAVERIGSSPSA